MNERYGRLVTDEKYIQSVTADMQGMVEEMGLNEYTHDAIADMIIFRLDRMKIYPDDIDYVFSALSF